MACYRKNSENKPWGLYFSKDLFEGLIFGGANIFGGAYLRREICVSKWIGLALQLEGHLPFLLCFTQCLRANFKYKPPGGLYLDGQFNGRFLALRVGGAYIWRGLFSDFTVAQFVIRALHQYRKGQGSNPSKPFRLSFGNCISCVFIWDAMVVFAFISIFRFGVTIYEFMYSLFQNKHNYVFFFVMKNGGQVRANFQLAEKSVNKIPGGWGTWVNFCWVCTAGLPHYSLFCGQL